jgi:hypothetical protein
VTITFLVRFPEGREPIEALANALASDLEGMALDIRQVEATCMDVLVDGEQVPDPLSGSNSRAFRRWKKLIASAKTPK